MIPTRFRNCTFETYPQPIGNGRVISVLKDFAKNPNGRSILLIGNVGVGKTGLAIATLKEYLNHHKSSYEIISDEAIFEVVPDLLDTLRQEYDSPGEDYFSELKKCKFLVLDDLGAEKRSEWVLERIFQLINYRYNWFLPTLITTNLTLEEMTDAFGAKIVSRLLGMADVYEIKGKDLRLEK